MVLGRGVLNFVNEYAFFFLHAATVCVAKVWSYSLDSLIGNHISQALEGTFSPYMPSSWPRSQTLSLWPWCW